MGEDSKNLMIRQGVLPLPGLVAPVARKGRGPYISREALRNAMLANRGKRSLAAAALGCSHTTVDERVKADTAEGAELREIEAASGLRVLASAHARIERAVDDTCFPCNGSGRAPVRPKFEGDADWKPCPFCCYPGSQPGYHMGQKEKDLDARERREWAWRYIQRQSEGVKKFKVPVGWFDFLEENNLVDAAIEQLLTGISLEEVYKGTMKLASGAVELSRQLEPERGPDEPDAEEDTGA